MTKLYQLLYFVLFAILLLLLLCLVEEGEGCFLAPKLHIHIISNLPPNSPPLTVHCRSKDDDLGVHTLTTGQDYQWPFCLVPFSTLFYCDLVWGAKKTSFDAYNARKTFEIPCNLNKNNCVFEVQVDGVYFKGEKKSDWQ